MTEPSETTDEPEATYEERLRATALAALVKAGAVARCPDHTEVLLRIGDEDSERHAQAMAGHLADPEAGLDRTEILVAIREVLDETVATCPLCATP